MSGLIRQRLLRELVAGQIASLAVVVAPAGFGKTTLLAHYAHAFPGPVGWLSLNPSDAETSVFATRLREAFPVVLPPLKSGGNIGEAREIDAFVRATHAAVTTDMLLVLDDAHTLDGSGAESALERLMVSGPSRLHVAIGTRRMPGVNLARHELAGLVVIDAERLRFRTWETEGLLRDIYREPLPPADAAALTRRVGGWVAGLHLFHLSTRGHSLPNRRAAVAALDGRASLCRAYLGRTVLAELPVDLHDFLVRTSVFDVLTPARCDRLLGRRDSQRRLEELSRLQAFTTSPDGGRTYTYHQVMRSHLAVTLTDELGEDAARRCYADAAGLLENDGDLAEAARAYARAEDWSNLRRLLSRIGAGIVEGSVEPWHDVLPSWLVAEDPWLTLAEGRQLFSRGHLTAAVECFARAEALFGDEHGRSQCRRAASRATAWLPGRARVRDHWSLWLRAATQSQPATVAAQAAQLPDPERRVVRLVAYALAGQIEAARRLLSNMDIDQPGVAGIALRLLYAAAEVAAGQATAAAQLARVGAEAERAELPWFDRMARAAVALDRTEQGAKAALSVAEECARDGDGWGQVIALGLAWLAQAGAEETDVDSLTELVGCCRRLDAGVLEVWARALHAIAAAGSPAGRHTTAADADEAATAAATAGVPGAHVAALIAAARVGTDRGTRLNAARRLAGECGLPACLVSAWSGPPPRAARVGDAPATVLCLGGFHASFEGRPVDLARIKPRARVLMRLLAMRTGQPVHREVLVDALWPGVEPAAANHNLHVALSSLRKLLEPGSTRGRCRLLAREGDAYLLTVPSGGYCDVAEVRTALDDARRAHLDADKDALTAALNTVLTAYRGDLLPEDGGAEWVVHEREVLRRGASDAGATLAALELARGDTDAALGAAERSIAIDRYNDEAWRLLIGAHQRDDDLAAARRVRSQYAQMLTDLGLDPSAGRTRSY